MISVVAVSVRVMSSVLLRRVGAGCGGALLRVWPGRGECFVPERSS
jgi:hypothetical protein